MRIIINITGFIGSILLILYGLLADGWITPDQVNRFSQQYGYLNLILFPMAGGLGYHLSQQLKPKPQNEGNDQLTDLLNAAYGGKPSIQIEEQPRAKRRIIQ